MPLTRHLTLADRCIIAADGALGTLFGRRTTTGRAYPPERTGAPEQVLLAPAEQRHGAGLMRVNHAGEIAAQGLYQGQALTARLAHTRERMYRAALEENDHLAWCERRLEELGSHPSRLAPVWLFGSMTLGALAGLAGDRWSLGFVAETEKQVVEHLEGHFQSLPEADVRSRAVVAQMREDEARHARDALAAGGAPLPEPVRRLMAATAKIMTTSAYYV